MREHDSACLGRDCPPSVPDLQLLNMCPQRVWTTYTPSGWKDTHLAPGNDGTVKPRSCIYLVSVRATQNLNSPPIKQRKEKGENEGLREGERMEDGRSSWGVRDEHWTHRQNSHSGSSLSAYFHFLGVYA